MYVIMPLFVYFAVMYFIELLCLQFTYFAYIWRKKKILDPYEKRVDKYDNHSPWSICMA